MSNRAKELKPLLLKTSFLLLNFSLLFTLCGCFYKDPVVTIREYGYFQYIIAGESTYISHKDDDSLIIVGFTDSGKEQETLDIPREIDGHPVKLIGLNENYGFWHNLSHEVHCSDKLRKIYIFDNIERIEFFYGAEVEIMVCSETNNLNFYSLGVAYKNMYFYRPLYEELGSPNEFKPANINFMNNYPLEDNGGLYRLDNIEASENIPEPPDPTIEGYEFTGWYTELECINEWNYDRRK